MPILSVVLSHDPDGWLRTGERAEQHFGADYPASANRLRVRPLDFGYLVVDLRRVRREQIVGPAEAQLTLLLFREQHNRAGLIALGGHTELWEATSEEWLVSLHAYLHLVLSIDKKTHDAMLSNMQTQRTRNRLRSFVDEFREDGRLHGLQEGRQEGRREGQVESARRAVVRVAEARFGEAPYLLHEYLNAVKDPGRLEDLCELAVRAESLERLLEKLR